MAFGKPLLFYFLNEDGDYYYINNNGDVDTTSTKTPLKYAPEGWEKIQVKWARSLTYWGLMRSVTTPFKFLKDGAQILTYLSVTFGRGAYCNVLLEKIVTNDGSYTTLYEAKIDFETFHYDKVFVTVNLKEGGLSELITNKDTTPFELPMISAYASGIHMDGVVLQTTYNYIAVSQTKFIAGSSTPPDYMYLPLSPSVVDGEEYGAGDAKDVYMQNYNPAENYVFIAGQTATAHMDISGAIFVLLDPSAASNVTLRIRIRVYQDFNHLPPFYDCINSPTYGHIIYEDPIPLAPGDSHTAVFGPGEPGYNGTYDFTLNEGNIICVEALVFAAAPVGANVQITVGDTTKFVLKTETKLKSTATLGIRQYEMVQRFVDVFSGGDYVAVCHWLNDPSSYAYGNYPYNTWYVPADNIRGLGDPSDPDKAVKLKTTLLDLFKDLTGRYCMGMGIVKDPNSPDFGRLEIEPLSHFLDPNAIIADLGFVSGFEIDTAKDYLYNQIKIGYRNQNYDNLNGRDEFNTQHVYSYPDGGANKTLDLTCPYRADMYGIEIARADTGRDTTDRQSDEDIFIVTTGDTTVNGDYQLYRPATFIQGLLFPDTAFNYDITPKGNLFRNAPLIKAQTLPLSGTPDYALTFQTSDKNRNLVATIGATTINESADFIPYYGEGDPLFYPYEVNFPCRIPNNIIDLINAKQYGCFRFKTFNKHGAEVELKIFPTEIGFYPTKYDVYNIKGLLTPDSDISQIT